MAIGFFALLAQIHGLKSLPMDLEDAAESLALAWFVCVPLNLAGLIAALVGFTQPDRKQTLTKLGLLINGTSILVFTFLAIVSIPGISSVTSAPSEAVIVHAERHAAELFSTTWAGTDLELDPWHSGYLDPQVRDEGSTWVVDGVFQINEYRCTQVTVTLEKNSYKKKSLELQKNLRSAITDLAQGKHIPPNLNYRPNEQPGGRIWSDPETGGVRFTPPP